MAQQRPFTFRHRRRGRLDPDRRGPHAADHLRPGRGPRALRRADTVIPRLQASISRRTRRTRTVLTDAGSEAVEDILRQRRRAAARGHRPLRRRTRSRSAPRHPGAARHKLFQRDSRLHRQGRRGRHHRRVHRPHDGRRRYRRPAPGARGQGAGRDPAGEPDAGLDHLPELFPHVPKLAGMTGTAMTEASSSATSTSSRWSRSRPTSTSPARTPTTRSIAPWATRRRDRQADRGVPDAPSSRCWSARCRSKVRAIPLSDELKKRGIPHNVLNARYHEQEAQIVAQAGGPAR